MGSKTRTPEDSQEGGAIVEAEYIRVNAHKCSSCGYIVVGYGDAGLPDKCQSCDSEMMGIIAGMCRNDDGSNDKCIHLRPSGGCVSDYTFAGCRQLPGHKRSMEGGGPLEQEEARP